MKKIISITLCCLIFCTCVIFMNSCSREDNTDTVTVTDMLGETVNVKKNPTKVACVSRTTYDLLIAFGLGDRIDGVYNTLLENEWACVFDKNAFSRYACEYEESYETFISRGVDIVFSPEKYITDGLREHGINALNISLYGNPSFEGYVYFFADLVKQIWDDDNVAKRVDEWKNLMSSTVADIQNTLSEHDISRRSVYYVRGDKNKGIGYTDTGKSFVEYAYRILGMNYLGSDFGTNKPSAEAIADADPDVFVIGGIYQKTLEEVLKTTAPYTELDAVKNNMIYNIPVGLTPFEQLSVFSPVFLCDQANKLYPEYFGFDTVGMIIDYSMKFFGVAVTETEAENMLNGLGKGGNPLA